MSTDLQTLPGRAILTKSSMATLLGISRVTMDEYLRRQIIKPDCNIEGRAGFDADRIGEHRQAVLDYRNRMAKARHNV
jgi:hypothetical protein